MFRSRGDCINMDIWNQEELATARTRENPVRNRTIRFAISAVNSGELSFSCYNNKKIIMIRAWKRLPRSNTTVVVLAKITMLRASAVFWVRRHTYRGEVCVVFILGDFRINWLGLGPTWGSSLRLLGWCLIRCSSSSSSSTTAIGTGRHYILSPKLKEGERATAGVNLLLF